MFATAAFSAMGGGSLFAAARARRLNILYMMSDDHAAHAIGAYGSRINKTPHMDEMARSGMILSNCFCTNPICTPSRGGILTGEICAFRNLPRVSDVLRSLEILRSMGARIRFCDNGDVLVDYATVRAVCPPAALTGSIRGSTYLLGAMLGRFGRAMLRGAGGCDFGVRPIDQHLLGFRALGATVREGETLLVEAENGFCGAEIIAFDAPDQHIFGCFLRIDQLQSGDIVAVDFQNLTP